MLWIKDTSTVPPSDWVYHVEATNYDVRVKNYAILYPEIVKHCRSNNVPVPSQEDVIRQLCERLYIPCVEGTQPLVNTWTQRLPPPAPKGCCGQGMVIPRRQP